jgi:hypothetical protein
VSSTISASWNQLYTLFVAAQSSTLSGVQVTAGPPTETEEQEVVALLGWGDPEENAAQIGGNASREERYRIEVAIKAEDPAGTSLTVMARLLAIADAVRDIVRAHPRLVGEVMCQVVRRRSDGPLPARTPQGTAAPGWSCFDLMEIECWAPRVT